MDKHNLIKKIRIVFADVRREDGISLMQAEAIDNFETPEQIEKARIEDKDSCWWDIDDKKLESHPVMAHMDAKGFRYYLPAFMTWSLLNYEISDAFTVDSTIYILSPTHKDKLWDHYMMHYSLFTGEEKKVIVDFLQYFSADGMDNYVDSLHAKKALDKYWGEYA